VQQGIFDFPSDQAGETSEVYRPAEKPVAQCDFDRGSQTISYPSPRQTQFRRRYFHQGTDLGHCALQDIGQFLGFREEVS
jgi:hypothetical protein